MQPVPATDRYLAGISVYIAGLGAKWSALALALTLAATLAAHAITLGIGAMLLLALATALALAHAATISRPSRLGRASGDKAGHCYGQGEKIEYFHHLFSYSITGMDSPTCHLVVPLVISVTLFLPPRVSGRCR
ncbi:MAG: hypothetical protein WAT23_10805 [Chromatiaceae bacterium]